jgi:hypothetical protein
LCCAVAAAAAAAVVVVVVVVVVLLHLNGSRRPVYPGHESFTAAEKKKIIKPKMGHGGLCSK